MTRCIQKDYKNVLCHMVFGLIKLKLFSMKKEKHTLVFMGLKKQGVDMIIKNTRYFN